MKPKVIIITGYGVNCEAESFYAWKLAGAKPSLVHINDLLINPDQILHYNIIMFIGGFSYGDHMTSGHVFAQRIKQHMQESLSKFISQGKLILGICNGFQVMTKIGLLPGLNDEFFTQKVSLIQNDCGSFQNFWVNIKENKKSPCVFTKDINTVSLPIRHGEGKLFTLEKNIIKEIEKNNCVPVRYVDANDLPTQDFPNNPNGSINAIAGLCNPSGRIFGMMPHPEAYLFPENYPHWDMQKVKMNLPDHGLGLLFFRNAIQSIN